MKVYQYLWFGLFSFFPKKINKTIRRYSASLFLIVLLWMFVVSLSNLMGLKEINDLIAFALIIFSLIIFFLTNYLIVFRYKRYRKIQKRYRNDSGNQNTKRILLVGFFAIISSGLFGIYRPSIKFSVYKTEMAQTQKQNQQPRPSTMQMINKMSRKSLKY